LAQTNGNWTTCGLDEGGQFFTASKMTPLMVDGPMRVATAYTM
jgi:hypothetical protein